ncbi:MAG: DUF1987 domain-containing protein [Alkalispirochaeta sp.]
MQPLHIEKSKSTPSVDFDAQTGVLAIGGDSYPEDSHQFFDPLLRWVGEFLSETTTEVTFRVDLTYMNTSSTKYMIDMLDQLEAAHGAGRRITVEWFYDEDNDREIDTIEELKEDFDMPFSLVAREW